MSKAIPVEFYLSLHKEHLEGVGLMSLAKKYSMRYATIYYAFKRLKLSMTFRSNDDKNRSGVNHNYFDKIDCENKAYLLGLIMSDGCVNKRKNINKSNRLMFKLHKDDKYLVEFMAKEIAPFSNLSKDKNSFRLEINSNRLVKALNVLGVDFNKILNGENLPDLPEEMYPHFIRGFFDGDGSYSDRKNKTKPNVNICSIHKEFLEKILLKIKIDGKIYCEKRETKDMYRLVFTSHKTRIEFFNYIYSNCSIYMKRKYEPYFKYVNTVLNRESKSSLSV